MLTEIKIALGLWDSAESAGTLFATKHCSGGSKVAIDACSSWIELFYFAEAWHGRSISVARNVMFSGKQTTARKIADQLKNCVNQGAHRFYSNRIHTEGSVWITDTITNVMIRYNSRHLFTECRCSNASWVQERRSQQEEKTVVKNSSGVLIKFHRGQKGYLLKDHGLSWGLFFELDYVYWTDVIWSLNFKNEI